jgi:hypothetical protein
MKLLSVDVGIKNLSFCLFEIDDGEKSNQIKIIKWDNIDLSDKNEPMKCIEIEKNIICNKPAKFNKANKCYCLKHSKKQPFLQPKPDLKLSFINKQKIQSLIEISKKYNISYNENSKKIELIQNITNFVNTNCFIPVEKGNASKVDLVTIGRNIQHKFDNIFYNKSTDNEDGDNIDTIIIENQIGPIANKMKTIQGMISQYFIMKNNNIKIEFISACNKLKDFIPPALALANNSETESNTNIILKPGKMDYKQRKQLGVKTSLHFVDTDDRFKVWSDFLHKHSKKDDLSDCFLQGMWYIKNKL